MKLGIITFHRACNPGAVLQAWALTRWLEAHGHTTVLIDYRHEAIEELYQDFYLYHRKQSPAANLLLSAKRSAKHVLHGIPAWRLKTARRYRRFLRECFHKTRRYPSLEALRRAAPELDALICGSDQIWNALHTHGLCPAYFLDFGPAHARRISYAASLGEEALSPAQTEELRRLLARLDYLSVREAAAVNVLAPLTRLPVRIAADPTLLIDRAAYLPLMKKTGLPGGCLYVHNVHITMRDPRLEALAETIARLSGLKLVYNRADGAFDGRATCLPAAGPREFLTMIRDAAFVVTNSFHATTFSILLERPFLTSTPINAPGRAAELLSKLGLEDHLVSDASQVRALPGEIDWAGVREKITALRAGSEEFLKEALA